MTRRITNVLGTSVEVGANGYVDYTPREPHDNFPMFHWAPSSRRNSINRSGFMPGKLAVDGLWRPPFTCWANDPQLAWQLSGAIHPEIPSWDLWQTFSTVPEDGYEERIDFDPHLMRHYTKEYRVYTRIYKRDIWFVGVRGMDAVMASA